MGVGAFWDAVLSMKCGIRRIEAFDPSGYACQLAGELPGYKIADHVPKSYRKSTKVMARDIELAVVAADLAFRDAQIQSKAYAETPSFSPARFGCNVGSGLISCELDELTIAMRSAATNNTLDLKKWGGDGMNQLNPLWMLKYLPNMLACHVSIIHGLMGPSNTITCGDTSSHLAIGEAFRTLQRGKAEMAICGGAQSPLNPMGMTRLSLLKRLNEESNDAPELAVRPFDTTAAGSIYGEGGGLMILEEFEHAKARGAKIYAELAGFGASHDTYKVTAPDPSGHSYGLAIRNALRDANVSPDDVDLLVPHGVGIVSCDQAELNGLSRALGSRLSTVPMGTLKPLTGNLAAGCGVDATVAVLGLYHGVVPAARNTHKLPEGVKLNAKPEPREIPCNVAVTSSYTLGGQNAALVFRKV
jgi:3-oxoacyl-[acyl-carrier-protein] synthase II